MFSFILDFLSIVITFIFFIISTLFIALKLWFDRTKGVCKSTAKLHGKVALVTGGSSGIGLETARDLASRGATVIVASIEPENSEKAVADIISTTGNHKVEYRYLNLASFASVRQFAEDFNRRYERLDILVNNAGCNGLRKKTSEDGIDMIMQINYFGPFLLTNLLLDKLIASKPSRIVIVSSYAHHFAKFNVNDLKGMNILHYYRVYANSKLCNILWTKALAKKLPPGVTVNALHPGVVKTNIYNKLPPLEKKILLTIIDVMFKSAKEGAQTSIHLCVAEELENISGVYFADCKPCNVSKLAEDEDLINEVWRKSILLTKNVK